MSKGIAIKSFITLVILTLLYTVFWFFNASQVEKKIANFIRTNSSHISSGEIAVSGFPLSQNVSVHDLTFTIPSPALDKYQTSLPLLEAKSSIFSNHFTVLIADEVLIKNLDGSSFGYVAFNQNPDIKLSLGDGMVAKFSYSDSGYHILNEDKISIYLASSSDISFSSTKDSRNKITNNLKLNIRDIEGFDILTIYKNVMEKNIINGIKTGEINVENAIEEDILEEDTQEVILEEPAPTDNVIQENNDLEMAEEEVTPQAEEQASEQEDQLHIENLPLKGNVELDIQYALVPNYANDHNHQDPMQLHKMPTHYHKIITVNHFNFSNESYSIAINGTMNSSQDDVMPSGAITVTVDNLTILSSHLSQGFMDIATQEETQQDDVQTLELSDTANLPETTQAIEEPAHLNPTEASTDTAALAINDEIPAQENILVEMPVEKPAQIRDPYQIFLDTLASRLSDISHELAQKNQLTEGESAVFDIRREKNIEVLINETPIREILGKL